jgi:hypothetical protein
MISSESVRQKLDLVATVFMIAASVLLIRWVLVAPPTVASRPVPPTYQPGEILAPIAGFDAGRTPKTLIMYLASACRFCSDSMDLYRRLAAQPGRIRIVVIGTDTTESLQQYLQANGVRVDEVVTFDARTQKLHGTPTLLLVDARGVVLELWRGRLDVAREREVMEETRSSG